MKNATMENLKCAAYQRNTVKNKMFPSEFLTHQMCLSGHLGCILTVDVDFYSLGSEITDSMFVFSAKRQR